MSSRGRGYQREQRDRIIAKRIGQVRRWQHHALLTYRHPGEWFKRHPLDCGRARCGICHYDDGGSRTRQKRDWRKREEQA